MTDSEPAPDADPDADPVTDPDADPVTDPDADPVTDPDADPATDPDADPATDPDADPVTDPDADAVTYPDADADVGYVKGCFNGGASRRAAEGRPGARRPVGVTDRAQPLARNARDDHSPNPARARDASGSP